MNMIMHKGRLRTPSPIPAFNPLASPLTPWFGLALKTTEMLVASSVVIGQRLTRVAFAGPRPGARDRREFHRMGQEKLDAGVESALAMAIRLAWMGPQAGAAAFQQWMQGSRTMMSLGMQPTATVAEIQATLGRSVLNSMTALTRHGTDSAANLAQQGLRPIHSRATANARRLLKS